MKFILALLFLASLACAQSELKEGPNPEGAADAYYGYYGYPGYYGGYGRYYGGYGYGYGRYGWGRKKREADPAVLATTHAAPAVVPHLGYGLGYAYGAPYLHHAVPHTYTVAHKDAVVTPGAVDVKVHAPVVPAVTYAAHYGYGLPWGYGYGLPVLAAPAAAEEPAVADARKKREAEAEPEADAAADAYYRYYGHPGYYGYGYGRYYGGYYGLGYGRYYGWGK